MSRIDASYGVEKADSERLDLEYGFATEAVENEVRTKIENKVRASDGTAAVLTHVTDNKRPAQIWNHLSAQIFQTPYAELERIVEEVDSDGTSRTWIDVGCAYGRLGIVLARLRPGAIFLGAEISETRVREAKRVYSRLGLDPNSLRHGDVAEVPISDGDIFFIYDFGHRDEIERVIERLRELARLKPIRVIGRGRAVRDVIEKMHPWLAAVYPALHHAHYSIYRSG